LSKGRLVVTYFDGSWTDNLAIAHYGLLKQSQGLTLQIDVESRERPGKVRVARLALADFVAKRLAIQTIQIGKPAFTTRLRQGFREQEDAKLGLKLRAEGTEVVYPAGVVFGPDEVTLNLG